MTTVKLTAAQVAAEQPEAAAALRADGKAEGDRAGYERGRAEGEKAGAERGRAEGKAEGIAAERARILGIDKLALPGCEALASECKADGSAPEAFAVKLVELQRTQRSAEADKVATDAKALKDAPTPGATKPAESEGAPSAGAVPATDDDAKKRFEASAELQKEFGKDGLAAYVAWAQAERAGVIKQYGRPAKL